MTTYYKKRWVGGQKMSIFVHVEVVKNGQNCVHVFFECLQVYAQDSTEEF